MGAVLHRRPADPAGYTVETAEHILLPDTRFELHNGVIPNLLERQGHHADTEVGPAIAPEETRVLDVAVFRHPPDMNRAYFPPGEIATAVNVVSPSSEEDDYVDKPALYARLGISRFWRVDHDDDVTVEQFTLDVDDRMSVPSRTLSIDTLEVEQPR